VLQRLTPLEVSVLALDTARTPGQVGSIDILQPGPDGFDCERLMALIRERVALAPRYRQRVRGVPGRLAGPVWVDDESFDLTFHVRRSALPRPGTPDQLREFAGRVLARRLDRSRPLWELYLVEGLQDEQVALVTKSHLSLVDGVDTLALGQLLFHSADADATSGLGPGRDTGAGCWQPRPEPSALDLALGAVWENATDPVQAVENLRGAVTDALGVALAVGESLGGVGALLGGLAGDALRGRRPDPASPLTGVLSEQRRVATVAVPLADLRAVRDQHEHTINDVVLAVLAGALRSWLLTRGESLSSSSGLTALVPMSVTEDDGEPSALGSAVAPHLQRLPIGEPNALIRLHQVAYGTQAHKDTGRAVAARSLADLAGFAPATLHALGVRASVETMRRPRDLLITNGPGPQQQLALDGARLVASYPLLPLAAGNLLSIGVTSYDGEVFFGLLADRDALSDLDVLASCLTDALEELLDTTVRGPAARQPTRKASASAQRAAAKKAAQRQEVAGRVAGQRRAAVRLLAARAAELGAAGRAAGTRPGPATENPADPEVTS
jgi:diacylglycerol O-acyltransferase